VGRPWGGRWLGLDHLIVKYTLAHLAARTKKRIARDFTELNGQKAKVLTFLNGI
jgi:hypothetical protein